MGRKRVKEVKRLYTADETRLFGAEFAKELGPNAIIALRGDLGAGKTTFVQGLIQGFNIPDAAQSPTFTYLQIYDGATPIYHFDLYRLKSERDFVLLGFEEFLFQGGVAAIEWPDRIASLIPPHAWLIDFSHDPSGRIATFCKWQDL